MSLTPEEIAYYQANASDDLRPNQIAACTCGIAFAVSAVVARMISRRRSRVKLGWDDYAVCVALVSVRYPGVSLAILTAVDGPAHICLSDGAECCQRRGPAYNLCQGPEAICPGIS